MEFLFIENYKGINMSAEIVKIGRYSLERNDEMVSISNDNGVIYRGRWHDSLNDFFDKITSLPDQKKEYALELAFDLPSF